MAEKTESGQCNIDGKAIELFNEGEKWWPIRLTGTITTRKALIRMTQGRFCGIWVFILAKHQLSYHWSERGDSS
ncbi:MAG: hypothetical protein SCM11_14970 [Bacillota bacterium]|nr:hypothetical protein [Bacillota bacterium]